MAIHQHVAARVRVELELMGAGNGWTNVSRDVFANPGVQIRRGIRGNGVNDLVAQTGTCTFTLDNMRSNSAGVPGYYSPDHPSCRMGFAETIGVRIVVESPAVGYEVVFIGTIDDIKVTPGNRGRLDVSVICVDWMDEAATFMLSGLATQTNKRADELLTTLLATPDLAQPVGTSFDVGKDTFPFAFESIRDGQQSARAEIDRIAHSGGSDRVFLYRDGVLRYENRDYRFVHNVDPTFRLNNSMMAMEPKRARGRAVNRIEVTAHPRTVDDDYVVLYSHQEMPFVAPGGSITVKGEFKDPDNQRSIGAVDVQTPLVAGLDYSMDTVQAAGVGNADTPFTDRPASTGFYGGFTGAVADVADDSDATGMTPNGGVIYHSFVMGGLPGSVPNNAAVGSVRTIVRIRHNANAPHYANVYWKLRYNGIELEGTISSTGTESAAGVYEFPIEWPLAPGAANWNAEVYNNTEIAIAFNWDNAVPELLSLKRTCIYASQVTTTDRTSDFAVVATAGGNAATFEITNNGADGAYVTRLQIRGKRIFAYDPATIIVSDAASILRNKRRDETFDMPYQPNSSIASLFGTYVVRVRKDPRTDIEQLSVFGNRSDTLMRAAVTGDVSTLVEVVEPQTGVSAKYWINGVDLTIRGRGLVLATWLLERADDTPWWIFGVEGRTEFNTTNLFAPI